MTRSILLLGMVVVLAIIALTFSSRDDLTVDGKLQLPSPTVGTGRQLPPVDIDDLKVQLKNLNEDSLRRARDYDKAAGGR